MDHSYQLSRPSIERIIDYCNDLLADDTEDVYVTDGSLYRELERINSYTDMGTL